MSAGTPIAARADAQRKSEEALERALTCAFWRAVQADPMPVMAALEAAARAVGNLYRRTAAAHGPDGACGCGWQPDPEADLIVLEAMLAAAVMRPPSDEPGKPAERPLEDLAGMAVAGRA